MPSNQIHPSIESLLNKIEDAVVICDLNGLVLLSNQKADQILFGEDNVQPGFSLYEAAFFKDTWKELKSAIDNSHQWLSSGKLQLDNKQEITLSLSASTIIFPDNTSTYLLLIARDISEQIQLESESKNFRRLVESAQDMVWRTDPFGNVTYTNPGATKILGFSQQEAVGKGMYDYMTKESADQLVKLFTDATLSLDNSEYQCEVDYLHKNGTKVRCELRARVIKNRKGYPIAAEGISRDISERKMIETALSQSEMRYRLIAENVSDVIWTMDWDLNFTYVSPSIEKIWGYSQEEILQIPLRNIMTEASFRRAMNIFATERQMESTGNADPGRNIVMNLEQYCKDGTIKWAEIKAKILYDSDCNPTGFLGVTRDISDRIEAQLKLMKSEQRYRRLAENAQDMIWRSDFAGTIQYVNPASGLITGFEPKELIGMTIFDYLTEDSAYRAIEELKKCLLSPNVTNSLTIELDYAHKDGRIVTCDVSATLIRNLKGNLIRMEGISRDITQKKKAEHILIDYEKKLEDQNYILEQKNTALNEFMNQMKEEKKRLEEQIAANVDRIIMPVLSRLKEKGSDLDRASLDMLEHNLKDMMSSFGVKISEKMSKLTQREIEICNMIKNGLTSKEIADILSISYRSVETHRNNIRKKLGIIKKEVNLATYLNSL